MNDKTNNKKKSFLNSFSCLKEMLKRSRGIFTFTQKCAKQKLPNEMKFFS